MISSMILRTHRGWDKESTSSPTRSGSRRVKGCGMFRFQILRQGVGGLVTKHRGMGSLTESECLVWCLMDANVYYRPIAGFFDDTSATIHKLPVPEFKHEESPNSH